MFGRIQTSQTVKLPFSCLLQRYVQMLRSEKSKLMSYMMQEFFAITFHFLLYPFLKNGPNSAFFGLFLFFSQCKDKYSTNFTINEKKA